MKSLLNLVLKLKLSLLILPRVYIMSHIIIIIRRKVDMTGGSKTFCKMCLLIKLLR